MRLVSSGLVKKSLRWKKTLLSWAWLWFDFVNRQKGCSRIRWSCLTAGASTVLRTCAFQTLCLVLYEFNCNQSRNKVLELKKSSRETAGAFGPHRPFQSDFSQWWPSLYCSIKKFQVSFGQCAGLWVSAVLASLAVRILWKCLRFWVSLWLLFYLFLSFFVSPSLFKKPRKRKKKYYSQRYIPLKPLAISYGHTH